MTTVRTDVIACPRPSRATARTEESAPCSSRAPHPDAGVAVRPLLREGEITAVHQPIHHLGDDSIIGCEALARMRPVAGRGPDRIVIELSEKERVDDYELLRADLERWHDAGARVAVDDTGSGYASLRHMLHIEPAFIKLDRSLIHGIEADRIQRALIASVVAFAAESGAAVIAEGVETPEQLVVLRDAGVGFAQGYLLGRPAPWAPALRGAPRRLAGARRPCPAGRRSGRRAPPIGASASLESVGAGVSIGLSAIPDEASIDAALQEADHQLYEAKRRRTAVV